MSSGGVIQLSEWGTGMGRLAEIAPKRGTGIVSAFSAHRSISGVGCPGRRDGRAARAGLLSGRLR